MKVYVLLIEYLNDEDDTWSACVPVVGSSVEECKALAFNELGVPLDKWDDQSEDGHTWVLFDRSSLQCEISDRDFGVAKWSFHEDRLRELVKQVATNASEGAQ